MKPVVTTDLRDWAATQAALGNVPLWIWLVGAGTLGFVALAIWGGGSITNAVEMMTMNTSKAGIRAAMRAAARRYGLDPDWLDAIAYVENSWSMGKPNMVGPDGDRGGAWGPTQITETTARIHGYTGDMAAFLTDLALAAEWTGKILAAGRPKDFAEAVSVWNAGRYGADKNSNNVLDPGESADRTVYEYWPKAMRAMALVQKLGEPQVAAPDLAVAGMRFGPQKKPGVA